jgi:type IX secretion system PorP/SprF family membrane protein
MKKTLLFILSCCFVSGAFAQGLHFSQFYNAPLLVNPANAALMPEDDYRIGVNYRTQWNSVPVPYKTTSFYADLQLLRNKLSTNWIGLGIANFNDKAGDGNLVLNKTQFSLAYHIVLN